MAKRVAVVTFVVLMGIAAYAFYRSRHRSDVRQDDAPPRERIESHFRNAGVTYPPERIAILVFKEEKTLALWADGKFIRHYAVTAASGHAGPKLREGDRQVPEGIYRIEHLNPNSRYHLSMKVSYPNDFDRRMARADRRTRLGGDIFIHGKAVSIGCVAVGDRAIEELFELVKATGVSKVKVIIAPNDLRAARPIRHRDAPGWTAGLYREIEKALTEFPRSEESPRQVAFR